MAWHFPILKLGAMFDDLCGQHRSVAVQNLSAVLQQPKLGSGDNQHPTSQNKTKQFCWQIYRTYIQYVYIKYVQNLHN
jgi:hypothetical protein